MSTSLPENWQQLLAGYVLDDVDEAEIALVEQWLDDPTVGDEVAAELEALQGTWDVLPLGLAPVEPPSRLRDRILTAVTESTTAQAVTPASPPALTASSPPPPTRPPIPWGKLLLGLGWVVTALALAVTWQENQRLRLALLQQEAVVASFSQSTNHLYTLDGTEAEPDATARLVISPADQTALIVTTDLPSLPTEQVYRLWALVDSDPVFCGQFDPATRQDTHQWALPDAACTASPVQMLVTAENRVDPPIPAGDLVLRSQS
ncbi:MAG: anti-sigma factor [Leptolyngbya sp. DLM2.Bin27]|nr:MAG: anti-sigma factor [Leptolyngbya sp. DLM2.Bin27]